WPVGPHPKRYWPPSVPHALTLVAFRDVFAAFGYSPCQDESLEAGFEKVAIFADPQGTPTHAARQRPNGRWTSKLGFGEDIEHDLRAVEGQLYGQVALLMKRPIPSAPSPAIPPSVS